MILNEFSHTEFVSHNLTLAAASYAIPQPSDIAALGAGVRVSTDALELTAPASNAGSIFVELTGTATAASLILRSGDTKRVSGSNLPTLSAIANNAGDDLEVTALYR